MSLHHVNFHAWTRAKNLIEGWLDRNYGEDTRASCLWLDTAMGEVMVSTFMSFATLFSRELVLIL